MKRIQTLKAAGLIGTMTIAALSSHAQTPAPSLSLEPLAFLTTHEWDARLPDSPDGKMKKIHARFTWAPSHQAIRVSNEFVTDGKGSPYIEGLYAWDPQQRTIVFWYVGAEGNLTKGTVKVESGKLVHEFQEISVDGKTADYTARVTPHENESWDNEIFARKPEGLTPLVKVRYEIAK